MSEWEPVVFLRAAELAERWGTTQNSLAQMRYHGKGPIYVRIDGVGIRYNLDSIEEYESQSIVKPLP